MSNVRYFMELPAGTEVIEGDLYADSLGGGWTKVLTGTVPRFATRMPHVRDVTRYVAELQATTRQCRRVLLDLLSVAERHHEEVEKLVGRPISDAHLKAARQAIDDYPATLKGGE
jgi:hypothetical protein